MGWAEFIEILERRLGMFAGRATYERAVAMVIGFDLAQDHPIHTVIEERVMARNGSGPMGWPWVLLAEALGRDLSARLDLGPLEADEDRAAIGLLSRELRACLADRAAPAREPEDG